MEDIKLTAEQTEEYFGMKLTNRDAVQILNAASKLEGREFFFGYDYQPSKPDDLIFVGFAKVDGEDVLNLGAILYMATTVDPDEWSENPMVQHILEILKVRWTLAA